MYLSPFCFNSENQESHFYLGCSKRCKSFISNGSLQIKVEHLIVQIGLEILTFLLLGNLYETLAGLFEILATPLFEGLDA